jgi:hypothetical protein
LEKPLRRFGQIRDDSHAPTWNPYKGWREPKDWGSRISVQFMCMMSWLMNIILNVQRCLG